MSPAWCERDAGQALREAMVLEAERQQRAKTRACTCTFGFGPGCACRAPDDGTQSKKEKNQGGTEQDPVRTGTDGRARQSYPQKRTNNLESNRTGSSRQQNRVYETHMVPRSLPTAPAWTASIEPPIIELVFKTADELQAQLCMLCQLGFSRFSLVHTEVDDKMSRTLQRISMVLSHNPANHVCANYSLRYNKGTDKRGDESWARFRKFMRDLDKRGYGDRCQVLLVSGSGAKPPLDTIACLEKLAEERNLELLDTEEDNPASARAKALRAGERKLRCDVGVAFNPYYQDGAAVRKERARLLRKLKTRQPKTVWLQFGTDPVRLVAELNWLHQEVDSEQLQLPRIIGATWLPTKSLLAAQPFTAWNGVFLSQDFLSSPAHAEAIIRSVLDVYRRFGIEVLVAASRGQTLDGVKSIADVAALQTLLTGGQSPRLIPTILHSSTAKGEAAVTSEAQTTTPGLTLKIPEGKEQEQKDVEEGEECTTEGRSMTHRSDKTATSVIGRTPRGAVTQDSIPFHFWAREAHVGIVIHEEFVQISTVLHMERERRTPDHAPLFLCGTQALGILSIKLDKMQIPSDRFSWVSDDLLEIKGPMGRRLGRWSAMPEFKLEMDIKIPADHSREIVRAYNGTAGEYCMQCEADRLKHITLIPADVHARHILTKVSVESCARTGTGALDLSFACESCKTASAIRFLHGSIESGSRGLGRVCASLVHTEVRSTGRHLQPYPNGSYRGYFIEGRRHGEGKMMYDNGEVYSGGWFEGEPQGKCSYTWPGGLEYNGDWKRDGITVNGLNMSCCAYDEKEETRKYQHQYLDGRYVGEVKLVENSKFAEPVRHGLGRMEFRDTGDVYSGQWKDNKRDGKGTYVWASGSKYEGEFQHDRMTGVGRTTWVNGSVSTSGMPAWKQTRIKDDVALIENETRHAPRLKWPECSTLGNVCSDCRSRNPHLELLLHKEAAAAFDATDQVTDMEASESTDDFDPHDMCRTSRYCRLVNHKYVCRHIALTESA